MNSELKRKNESGGLKALKDALNTTSIILRIAMIILLIAFLVSGMRNLEQYENAVVLRFGAESGEVRSEAGMQFALPYPVDQMIVVPVGRTQTLSSSSFMYQKNALNEVATFLKPGVDGYLMTSDGNILHCVATIKYQVENVSSYLFSLNQDERIRVIEGLLDNSVLKAVAKLPLNEALDIKQVIADSKLILQNHLDDLDIGIRVDLLDIKLQVPRQVTEFYTKVLEAKNKANEIQAEAEKSVSKSIDQTESEIDKINYLADIWKTRMLGRAEADLVTFEKLIGDYRKNPERVKSMLLRSAMAEVIGNLEELFIADVGKDGQMRLRIPRQPVNEKSKANEEE